MNAFVFPGQGSQKVGMGRSLCENSESARALFDRANEVLGYDLAQLCWEGPEEKLTDTRHAQPALLTVSTIAYHAARERGLEAQMTAGHSLGEYSALVASSALEFEEALRLVQRRAELMAAAPAGAMAAIVGLADEAVEEVVAAQQNGVVVAANYNAPGQVVVSGESAAIEDVMREAKARGAKMTVKLAVSGAFHSPLLKEAAEQLASLIEAAPFQDATTPVYQNTTARPATSAHDLKQALTLQMTSPVRWTQSVQAMIADGATQFYELGSGAVICGLIKRIDKSVDSENSDSWTQ